MGSPLRPPVREPIFAKVLLLTGARDGKL